MIKAIPCTHKGTLYAYRAWGSHGNDNQHEFYVSNDLMTWITACTSFIVPNAADFHPRGWVYFGFHDVILINGTYYAIAEANSGECMLARSTSADSVWEAFANIGGTSRPDGPLQVPAGRIYGWTASGSIVDLGYNRGMGSLFADPNKQTLYLAINAAAKSNLTPAQLEAAFIDSSNWTWHDGSTGRAANPILTATADHNYGETWTIPRSDMDEDWTFMYNAVFGSNTAIGYATLRPPEPTVKLKLKILLEGPYSGSSMRTDLLTAGHIPTISPYDDARDAGSFVPPDVVDWIFVQLRETLDGPVVAERSFFVKSDGTAVETDGSTEELTLTGTGEGNYFIVVYHRNHLAVINDSALKLVP